MRKLEKNFFFRFFLFFFPEDFHFKIYKNGFQLNNHMILFQRFIITTVSQYILKCREREQEREGESARGRERERSDVRIISAAFCLFDSMRIKSICSMFSTSLFPSICVSFLSFMY